MIICDEEAKSRLPAQPIPQQPFVKPKKNTAYGIDLYAVQ